MASRLGTNTRSEEPLFNTFIEFLISGISVGTATTFTNPIDVVKTRLQLRTTQQAPQQAAREQPACSGPKPASTSNTNVAELHHQTAHHSVEPPPPPVRSSQQSAAPAASAAHQSNSPSTASSGGVSSNPARSIHDHLKHPHPEAHLPGPRTFESSTAGGPLQRSAALSGTPTMAAAAAGGTSPSPPHAPRPAGLLRTGADIVNREGVTALWKGLPPALTRGFVYGGLRLGLYSPIKQFLTPAPLYSSPETLAAVRSPGTVASGRQGAAPTAIPHSSSAVTAGGEAAAAPPASFGAKVAAGSLSGGFAAALCSPTELVKTRLQAAGEAGSRVMEGAHLSVCATGVHRTLLAGLCIGPLALTLG